jgi:hypothetical protein
MFLRNVGLSTRLYNLEDRARFVTTVSGHYPLSGTFKIHEISGTRYQFRVWGVRGKVSYLPSLETD